MREIERKKDDTVHVCIVHDQWYDSASWMFIHSSHVNQDERTVGH